MILSKPPSPYNPESVALRNRRRFVLHATLAALRSGADGSAAACHALTAAKTIESEGKDPHPWEEL